MTMTNVKNELHILHFPDELLERIILNSCAKDILRFESTCKRAQDVCRRLYWRRFQDLNLVLFLRTECRVDVSNAYRFDLAAGGLLKRCGPFLKRLDLSKFGPLEYGLRLGLEHAVVEHCTQLTSIEINNRLLERDWLLKLSAATSRHLRRLSVSHVYVRNCSGFDDALLALLFRQWRHLETLIARDNKQLNMSCYADAPRTLKSLDVQGCSVYSAHIQSLLQRCERLHSLSITFSPDFGQLAPALAERIRDLDIDSTGAAGGALFTMQDHYVSKALANLVNVNTLTISSHLVNDAFFKMVAMNLRNLSELCIPGARPAFLTSVTFALLELTALPNLTKIGLRGNPMARTLLLICHRFKCLTEIDASYAIKGRDLEDAWQDIRSDTLRILWMRGFCPPSQDKAVVTRRILATLRATCPNLTSVLL